jgi:hypothetical protein
MGSLKSGLCSIAFASLLGTAAVVGCSASGDGADIASGADTTLPPDDGTGSTGKLPPSNGSSGGDTSTDSGAPKKDASAKPDATVDAGPPPPVEGTACTTLNATAQKACGACGKASTVCLADDGGTTGKWSSYGPCGGELAGGCVPGSVVNQACGNCGTETKTCNQYCAFGPSVCAGEPVGNCKAGSVEYINAGCTTASTYRNRTCGAACTWSGYSATCAAPVNDIVLNVPATVGGTAFKAITFSTAKMAARLSSYGSCPTSSAPSVGDYPYQYVEIHNPTAKAAVVTLYTSAGPSAVVIDTIMAAYQTPIQPMDDAGRQACTWGVNDQSSSDTALTGNSNFSILKAVPIPAGGSILVYTAAYYEYVAGGSSTTTGAIQMNVKVEQLN